MAMSAEKISVDVEVPWTKTPVWCLMILWYGSAAVAVLSSRSILKTISLPFSLSAMQFLLSTVFSYATLKWLLPWSTRGAYKPMIRSLSNEDPAGKLIRIISLSFTLGFILTNVSLSLCNASFTETVKASEPISSLLLATLLGGDGAVSRMEWMTTFPIVIGVALCSFSEASFNIFGFIAAVASNFMFSLRGINTKKLRRLHGSENELDDLHLFYYISKFGAIVVIPIALIMEGKLLLHLLSVSVVQPLWLWWSLSPSLKSSDYDSETTLSQPDEYKTPIESDAPVSLHPPPTILLVMLFIINGCCYFLYNQTSFIVLGKVAFITHATLNVMRRIFIIFFTSWYFNVVLSPLNMIGITMAMSGFALFLYFKNKGLISSQNKKTGTSISV